MTREQTSKIVRELELIRRADPAGVLKPEAIIDFARDPTTELHRHFTWNDSEAAQAYRLVQARQILRVQVTLLDPGDGTEQSVRAFVSLIPKEGYTETVDILSTKRGRRQLILKILERMSAIAQSYALPELKPITAAITKVQNTLIAAKPRGRPPTRRSSSRDKDSRISP
jgi:hypothetical protein